MLSDCFCGWVDEADTSTCSPQSVNVCTIHKLHIFSHLTFFSYHSTESLTVTAKVFCNFKRCLPTVLQSAPQAQINSASESSWFKTFFHELNGGENVLCYIFFKKENRFGALETQWHRTIWYSNSKNCRSHLEHKMQFVLICAGSNSAQYIDKILSDVKIVWENYYKCAFSIASSVFQLSLLVFC